jgi:hypothetical protein
VLRTEDEIRDYLATNLDSIEPGLEYYDKELYIPSKIGTRSFIDLVAKDDRGKLVLIELKRSAAASREAIHEILKYVEAVKGHLAIREDELRVLIASTDWNELLPSFSRLLADTTVDVKGVKLTIDGDQITGERVVPLPVTYGRILAPWHDVNFCATRERVAQVIEGYEKRNNGKGLEDYVLVVLHSEAGHISQHEATARMMIAGIPPDQGIADNASEAGQRDIVRYHYIVYFAAQLFPTEKYWSVLEQDQSRIDEYREEAQGKEGDELLCHLHEVAWSRGSPIERDYLEIGNAAKLYSRLLEDEQWKVWGILRYGSFERNRLLSDQTILDELCGSEGHSGQKFARSFALSNRAEVASVRDGIARCLEQNSSWKKALLRILQELQEDYPNAEAALTIFIPATGLLTPYFFAIRPEGPLYLPTFGVSVTIDGQLVRGYAGYLVPEGEPSSLDDVLREHYHGQIGLLMTSFSWGGRTDKDEELTRAYGCTYKAFRRDLMKNPLQLFCLEEDRWEPCEESDLLGDYAFHLQSHPEFFGELFEKIGERDHGTWWEY